ncbi:MAG TPA: copper chaperone PCu(A)C [Novosphingobium sp.]|nr:copper chaperone PCu(A)C [Novosphingobium sp.]
MEQDRRNGISGVKLSRVSRKDLSEVKIHHSLALSAAIAIAASLAACQKPETPASPETRSAPANPDAKPGISGSRGRLVLPVVAGHPAAVYFTLRNDGPGTATLSAIHVAGAGKAQMHKTEGGSMSAVDKVDIAPGSSVEFAPGGMHVMAFGLDNSLKAGENAELTLTFSDGDKLSMPLRMETLSGGMKSDAMGNHENMPGMPH